MVDSIPVFFDVCTSTVNYIPPITKNYFRDAKNINPIYYFLLFLIYDHFSFGKKEV